MSSSLRFATVVFDVDSTVAGIEGIDWLSQLRGPDVAARCAELTRQAMEGLVQVEAVYGSRLQTIAPSAAEIARLAEAYIAAIAPGCRATVGALRAAGVRVVLISGGFRPALGALASVLGIPLADLHAVGVYFTLDGAYAGFEEQSPLAMNGGKRTVLAALGLPRPVLAVGDGMTDLEMRDAADTFAAFTGFARREQVVRGAATSFATFAEVETFVLGGVSGA